MNRRTNLRILTSFVLWICFGSQTFGAIAPSSKSILIPNVYAKGVYATGYFCVYNCELAGSQTVTKTISTSSYTLKASFLYGGRGVAMQGSGRTGPGGDYIKYMGGGGYFIRLSGPNAGKNLDGQWVENPDILRGRYARMGITDFTGFGNLALRYPEKANFIRTATFTGSSGQTLTPWHSISIDPSFIPIGETIGVTFKDGDKNPKGNTTATFVAEDIGSAIKGRHIEIYLGEGEKAFEQWNRSGSNRYVDISFKATLPASNLINDE
jgi:3D (Asp-Asp-Asp) domain-containing protein